jgi:hypothetical protein
VPYLGLATEDLDVRTFDLGAASFSFTLDVDYRLCITELYTTYFGGTKLKRNYIWGYTYSRLNTSAVGARYNSMLHATLLLYRHPQVGAVPRVTGT